MNVNDEWETLWEVAIVAYFKAKTQNLSKGVNDNHEEPAKDSRPSSRESNPLSPEYKGPFN
jgi:hypothetical protein